MKKCKIPILIMVAAFLLTASLYAQDQDHAPGVYRTPEELQKPAEEGINSGWVVAYGVLLKRPYFVEFRDDTVWINNVPFSPTKKAPGWKRKTVVASHMDSLKYFTTYNIIEKYLEYRKTKGEQQARELIQEEYDGNPLVTKIEFGPERFTVHIGYSDGKTENILCDPSILEEQRVSSYTEEKEHDVQGIKSFLETGGMLIFSYTLPIYNLTPGGGADIEKVIGEVKNKIISRQEGEEELARILDREHAKEILDNINSW